MITTIGFAGDGLLWNVDASLSGIQERFRALVAEHGAAPAGETQAVDADSALGETWTANLGYYGYGVKAYTLSMIETALTITHQGISAAGIAEIVALGKEMAESPISLTDWARPTIVSLTDRYRLLLIAQGDLFDQESRVARSGLAELFWRIDVVREKNDPTYRRLLARYQVTPEEFVMVGSNEAVDVEPVLAIGANAVHIPAQATWEQELGVWGSLASSSDSDLTGRVDDGIDGRNRHQVSTLGDLPELLLNL